MKKTSLITSSLLAIMLLFIFQANAQRGRGDNSRGNNFLTYLELDENQESQAKTFFTEMQKTVNPLRMEIKEKELELEKLMITDNVKEKTVYAKVDEIGQLKSEVQKARTKSKIQLRSILTDEQKVLFDSKEINGRKGSKKEKAQCKGQGNRQGNKMGKPQKTNK